jgi:hypothetical protein
VDDPLDYCHCVSLQLSAFGFAENKVHLHGTDTLSVKYLNSSKRDQLNIETVTNIP